MSHFPHVEILEQPASRKSRFLRTDEPLRILQGTNSVPRKRTFPTIQIKGHEGRAVVIVSCVMKDKPYMPHPHNVEGEKIYEGGVYTIEAPKTMIVEFKKLAIRRVERENVVESLKLRKIARVDPFRTGFDYGTRPQDIDLNTLRLCFQVFIEGPVKGKFNVPLTPIVTDPIYNKSVMLEPVISGMSHTSASVAGGDRIILLCDEVNRNDISVRFFEQSLDRRIIWESFADIEPEDVHRNSAIIVKTPEYKNRVPNLPVQVYIQLKRPSDGASSESKTFQFNPLRTLDNISEESKIYKKLLHQLNQSYLVKIDETYKCTNETSWNESARVHIPSLKDCKISTFYNIPVTH